ncbi:VOC family protein [Ketobacter sp.]|uniref:VOC family protein n=1 Tax=Ketobacter sp. TaxID=2083498 RepID=UPI0025B87549|nr:VOC family protein [Ketobacter sp.]
MDIESCIPVIPSFDLQNSLLFWRDGLGFEVSDSVVKNGELIFCMLRKSHLAFMLNQREGGDEKQNDYESIRLYWSPKNLSEMRTHLSSLGFSPSEIYNRDYGRTEFFLTDSDGFSHCFGVVTEA